MDGAWCVAEQTFGARLKELREAAGLTQLELADRAGVNRFTVAKLDQDQTIPSPPEQRQPGRRGRPKKQADEGTATGAEEPAPPKRRKGK
jgi:hypothetical protein